jgi:hypothetical protein
LVTCLRSQTGVQWIALGLVQPSFPQESHYVAALRHMDFYPLGCHVEQGKRPSLS